MVFVIYLQVTEAGAVTTYYVRLGRKKQRKNIIRASEQDSAFTSYKHVD